MKKYILKNNIEMVIRKAEEKDAEKFLEYFYKVGAETDFLGFGAEGPNMTIDECINSYKNSTSKNFFLIAEIDNKICGSCSINTNEKRIRLAHFGTLGIVVLKEYWGLGIGSILIEETIKLSKEAGLKKINLETRVDNKKAINLYKKFGFKEEGIITRGTFTNGEFFDILVMGLEI